MNEYIIICLEMLFSGLIAAIVTFFLQRHYMKYDLKYNIISDFFKYRYDITGDEFSRAINNIYLIFSDDENVVKSVDDFNNAINNKEPNDTCNNKLYNIYYNMCKNIKIKPVDEKKFSDKVFNIKS